MKLIWTDMRNPDERLHAGELCKLPSREPGAWEPCQGSKWQAEGSPALDEMRIQLPSRTPGLSSWGFCGLVCA